MYIYIYICPSSQPKALRPRETQSEYVLPSNMVMVRDNDHQQSNIFHGNQGEGRIKLPIELIGEEACTNSNTAFPVILRASNFHDVFKEFLERESNAAPYLDIEGVTQPTVHNTPS